MKTNQSILDIFKFIIFIIVLSLLCFIIGLIINNDKETNESLISFIVGAVLILLIFIPLAIFECLHIVKICKKGEIKRGIVISKNQNYFLYTIGYNIKDLKTNDTLTSSNSFIYTFRNRYKENEYINYVYDNKRKEIIIINHEKHKKGIK